MSLPLTTVKPRQAAPQLTILVRPAARHFHPFEQQETELIVTGISDDLRYPDGFGLPDRRQPVSFRREHRQRPGIVQFQEKWAATGLNAITGMNIAACDGF